jgi:hypothetical protein
VDLIELKLFMRDQLALGRTTGIGTIGLPTGEVRILSLHRRLLGKCHVFLAMPVNSMFVAMRYDCVFCRTQIGIPAFRHTAPPM